MINKEKFKELIEKGIDVGQYSLLCLFGMDIDINDLFQHIKTRAYREALVRKGFLSYINDEYELTNKGKEIIDLTEDVIELVNTQSSLDIFCKDLIDEVEEMCFEKTKKKKYKSSKTGKIYNCSSQDLKKRLMGFFDKFGTKELPKIRTAILIYTREILKGKIPYNLMMIYFVWKKKDDGEIVSEMLQYMDMEYDDPKELQNTRSLF